MKRIYELLRYEFPLHFFLFLTNWLPDNVVFLRFRGWLVRPFLGSCGKDLRIGRNVIFHNPKNIHFGMHVFAAFGCLFMATDKIIVDDEVMYGPYCVTISGNHTRLNGSFRYGPAQLAPIHIEKGAWIGSHAVITAGSHIGAGSLIAAGAVVHGEIPGGVMAGGLPAKVIKQLE